MKSLKSILLSALMTVGTFGAITYTACNKDECKDVVCQNGGTCSNGNCNCPTGYTGNRCQTKTFFGSWKGDDVCSSGTYNNITIQLDPSSTDTNSVIVTNPGGFGSSVTVSGTLSSDARTITLTNVDVTGGRTLTGAMTLTSNSAFTFSYTVTSSTGNDVCNGQYAKL